MLTVSEDGILFFFYGINLVHITSDSVFYKNYGSVNEVIDSDDDCEVVVNSKHNDVRWAGFHNGINEVTTC